MATLAKLLRAGELGPVALGDTGAEVRGRLGDPDDVSTSKRPLLWKYGSLELGFPNPGPDARLATIHVKSAGGRMALPKGMTIDDWSPEDSSTPAGFARWAQSAGLECLPDPLSSSETQLGYFVPPIGRIVFAAEGGEKTLYGIYVSRKDEPKTKQISVALAADDFERIKAAASREGLSVAALCKSWLEERARTVA